MADVHCKEIGDSVLKIAAQMAGLKPLLSRCSDDVCDDEIRPQDVANALVLLGGMAERLSSELSRIGERLAYEPIEV